ncbi:phosphotransferase family protein [Pseudonocardia sp. CA-107938]|uniref:phosphotransferase family protein n=1 Tax=Pseudonocardia sp. CA-107938 TaxID=3240021 RepID=UPI003D8E9586
MPEDDWTSAGWWAAATAWLDAMLATAGLRRCGEVTQPRVRRWGTVLTAPTSGGRVWLKATGPQGRYEPALHAGIAATAPRYVPDVLGLDAERGWLLLRDHAPDLGEPGDLLPTAVLVRYARLQRALGPQADALVAAGVPDMRPAVLPQRFDEAVAAVAGFVERHGRDGDRAVVDAVRVLRPTVVEWSEQLAASPVPASVDHGDLHARNVLVGGGAVRFLDWGDAAVAHPFASLLVPSRVAGAQAPRLLRAYLAAFADLASIDRLTADAGLAIQLARISRVLTWVRAVGVDGADPRFARAPLDALAELSGTTGG